MGVTRKSLMGIPVEYDLPWSVAIERGAPDTSDESGLFRMMAPSSGRSGKRRIDMTAVSFGERISKEDLRRFALGEWQRLALPQELLAVGLVCPRMASELWTRSLPIIAPRQCLYKYEPEFSPERDFSAFYAGRCVVGIRYVQLPDERDNMRIAFPYWFEEEYPSGYWFLLVDRLRRRPPADCQLDLFDLDDEEF